MDIGKLWHSWVLPADVNAIEAFADDEIGNTLCQSIAICAENSPPYYSIGGGATVRQYDI